MSEKSTNEFDAFYSKIKGEYERNVSSSELNSDRCHNAAIMTLMLEIGKKIHMFCGELSVFRTEFYEKIALLHGVDTADHIRSKVARALTTFLSGPDNTIEVVMESSDKDIYSDLIIDESVVTEALRNGRLVISTLNANFLWRDSLNHFAYCEDVGMLRTEDDKIAHSGSYVRKDSQGLINDAKENFRDLKLRSRRIA